MSIAPLATESLDAHDSLIETAPMASQTNLSPISSVNADSLTAKPLRRLRKATTEGERPSVLSQAIATGLVAVAAIYFLLPVVWLIIASTKSLGDLFTTPGFAFAEMNLFSNIARLTAFEGGIFWRWMFNSLIYSGLGSFLTMLVCALCGYGLAVYEFRGKKILLGAIAASLLVPGTVLAQPIFILLANMGLTNTYFGVIAPAMVYPFGVMLGYITAKGAIPIQVIEAARIDGAGELRIFFSVAWRMMGTGLTTIMLFAFVGSWNNFFLPMMVLNDPQMFPVTLGLHQWNQMVAGIPELNSLTIIGALLSVIPIAGVFITLQRYWRSGLAAGGVKL